MDHHEFLKIAGGVLALLLFIPLIAGILKEGVEGQSCATWFLWGLLDTVLTISVIDQRGNFLLPLSFAIGDIMLVVVLLIKGQIRWGLFETGILAMVIGCLVATMGLGSRRYGVWLPAFIAEYAGDTLWTVTAFIAIGLVAVRWPPRRVGLASLLVSYSVEVSQLYHAPWIDAIRATTPGALALGYGFLWSDIACYTVGAALCVIVEHLVYYRQSFRR